MQMYTLIGAESPNTRPIGKDRKALFCNRLLLTNISWQKIAFPKTKGTTKTPSWKHLSKSFCMGVICKLVNGSLNRWNTRRGLRRRWRIKSSLLRPEKEKYEMGTICDNGLYHGLHLWKWLLPSKLMWFLRFQQMVEIHLWNSNFTLLFPHFMVSSKDN